MKQDNHILRIEYDRFVTDNENKKENENKTIKETTKLGWEKGKYYEGLKDKKGDKWKVNNKRSAEDWTMVKSKRKMISRKKIIKITLKKHQTTRRMIMKHCQKTRKKRKRKFE